MKSFILSLVMMMVFGFTTNASSSNMNSNALDQANFGPLIINCDLYAELWYHYALEEYGSTHLATLAYVEHFNECTYDWGGHSDVQLNLDCHLTEE